MTRLLMIDGPLAGTEQFSQDVVDNAPFTIANVNVNAKRVEQCIYKPTELHKDGRTILCKHVKSTYSPIISMDGTFGRDTMTYDARQIIAEAKRTGENLLMKRHEFEGPISLSIGSYSIPNRRRGYLDELQFFLSEHGLTEVLPNQNLNHEYTKVVPENEYRLPS